MTNPHDPPYKTKKLFSHVMKKVIVNADDFGLTSGVNRGIIKAYREGILSSTTLMANMSGFSEAVELSFQNPGLGVGIHLNILRGEPLAPKNRITSLLRNGAFPGDASVVFKKLFLNSINLSEVEREWSAQIRKVLETGVRVTHIDSEKHLHCFPGLFRVAVKLAVEFDIRCIRYINEPFSSLWTRKIGNPQFLKLCLLNYCCKKVVSDLRASALKRTDYFFGVLDSGKMSADKYKKFFSVARRGVTEIMCHPGFEDRFENENRSSGRYYINNSREMEMNALLSPNLKDIAAQNGIDIIDFGDVK